MSCSSTTYPTTEKAKATLAALGFPEGVINDVKTVPRKPGKLGVGSASV
jgi:hypothetical protein